MVEVKFNLFKRDFVWIGLLVVLVGVGFVYGYNSGASPSVMGHSFDELDIDLAALIDNNVCNKVTGHDCGYDTGAVTSTWQPYENTVCKGVSFTQSDGTKTRTAVGTKGDCACAGRTVSWSSGEYSCNGWAASRLAGSSVTVWGGRGNNYQATFKCVPSATSASFQLDTSKTVSCWNYVNNPR